MSAPTPKRNPKKNPQDRRKKLQAVESIEPSGVDQADLLSMLGGDETKMEYHTLLEVWRDILAGSRHAISRTITPNWAIRTVTAWPQIKVQEMDKFRDRYFDNVEQLESILLLEIASDPASLDFNSKDADLEMNTGHYMNLIKDWQLAILQWELDWDCTSPVAHVELAAIVETHKFFFGQTGITGLLDQIGFQHTEDDQTELFELFDELREANSE